MTTNRDIIRSRVGYDDDKLTIREHTNCFAVVYKSNQGSNFKLCYDMSWTPAISDVTRDNTTKIINPNEFPSLFEAYEGIVCQYIEAMAKFDKMKKS